MSKQRGYKLITNRRNYANGINASNRGFTLIELAIVMVIVAIGVALAVPAYENVLQRRETTAQAEKLTAFLAYAQSEAVKSNELISVELNRTNANDWCVGASDGATGCDCTEADTSAADFCSVNGVAKVITSATDTRSSMSAFSVDQTLVFDPIRGTMDSTDLGNVHGFTLQSDNTHWQLQIDIGVTGRMRICNQDSDKKVPGYPDCPPPVQPLPPPPPPPPA
jgi:prepilin-type N-terminal cleavage/methylation domain-containing protein